MENDSRYKQAGVDLEKANALVDIIKPLARQTFKRGSISDIGGFGGLFSLNLNGMENPVLVSSTDGVGTKLKVAFESNKHDTVGIDLVAMVVNDIIVQGATPLFFLDYLAMGKIDLELVKSIVSGISEGCKLANLSLIGGETAELPKFYKDNEYDMAGFATGIVSKDKLVDGSSIRDGYQVIGLASSGLHSNGYSLVRKIIFDELGLTPDSELPACNRTVAEELLEPTKIYVKSVLRIIDRYEVFGMVHITGGGFYDNIPRILPTSCRVIIDKGTWPVPPIFDFLQKEGHIAEGEMYHVFNNGIGYILIVKKDDVEEIISIMNALGEQAFRIGEVLERKSYEPQIMIV
jgi:phosphoribosylformylglycinamidine cyclo-ligase